MTALRIDKKTISDDSDLAINYFDRGCGLKRVNCASLAEFNLVLTRHGACRVVLRVDQATGSTYLLEADWQQDLPTFRPT